MQKCHIEVYVLKLVFSLVGVIYSLPSTGTKLLQNKKGCLLRGKITSTETKGCPATAATTTTRTTIPSFCHYGI